MPPHPTPIQNNIRAARLVGLSPRRGNGAGARRRRLALELGGTLPEAEAAVLALFGLDQADAGGGSGSGGGDRGSGENKSPRAVDQVINERTRAADVAAGCAESFAECAHLDFNAAAQSEFLSDSALVCAVKSS